MAVLKSYPALSSRFFGAALMLALPWATARFCAVALLLLMVLATGARAHHDGTMHPDEVSITGTPTQGQTLTLDISGVSGTPVVIQMRWRRDGNIISGASGREYTLTQADVGKGIAATLVYRRNPNVGVSFLDSASVGPVANINDAPTISGTPNTTVEEGSDYSFTPTGEDIDDDDTLIYSITNRPSWATFSTATGTLTGTPGDDDVGDYENIVIGVRDGNIEAPIELAAFNIAVTKIADAGEPQTVDEGEEVTLDGSGSSGLPGDGRTYAWTQTDGTPVTLTGADTITATFIAPIRQAEDDGELEFELIVTDPDGDVSTASVIITVTSRVSVQETVDSINWFMEMRTRLILANQPDASRRIDRLRSGVGSEQLSFATGDLPKLMPIDFNPLDLGSGNYKFATSLDQITRAADHLQVAQGGAVAHERRRFDVWVEGSFHKFNGGAGSDGDFAIAHLGVDYLMSPDLLVGGMLQYDRLTGSNDNDNSRTEGTGWMVGPYVTARLQENLYLDARVAGGTSDNDVTPVGTYTDNFKSTRWLADVGLSGVFTHDQWTLRPNAALSWLADKQKSYTGTLGDRVPGQTVSQGQVRFGPTISTQFTAANGWVYEPSLTLDAIYSHTDTSGGGGFLTTTAGDGDGWRARVAPGISMTDPEGGTRLSLSGTYDGIGQSGYEAWGLGVKLNMKF